MLLQVQDLTVQHGTQMVLDNVALSLAERSKTGLVGRNGAGKSTLLDMIVGRHGGEAGTVTVQSGARIGMMAQETHGGTASPLEIVLAADEERAALLAEAERVETAMAEGSTADPGRIGEIHTRLAEIGAHSAPARAAAILSGLGFDPDMQTRPASGLSGGWRGRISLAALLFAAPDLLLLDEPSNHLDLEATIWLTGFLQHYPRALLLVSHDRTLLDAVTKQTLHLEAGRLTLYGGSYSQFVRTRAERRAHGAKAASKRLAQQQKIEAFVARFGAKATKARQAQSRLKALARMGPPIAVVHDTPPTLEFPDPTPLPSPLIALDGAAASYGADIPILKQLDLRVDNDDRIALLGRNGSGKSTLARLLAGRIAPSAGSRRAGRKLEIGYFAQHQLEELAAGESALRHLSAQAPLLSEQKLRAHLGRFGFSGPKADLAAGALSGGEKARLLFALASWRAPHLLILDEPTNHLDVEMREALVAALSAYSGAVILVSHDAHLIELVADRLWLVSGGSCGPFDGDLDDYRSLLANPPAPPSQPSAAPAPCTPANANGATRRDRRTARQDAAEERRRRAPLKRAADKAETRLNAASAALAAIERDLADPAAYENGENGVQDLLRQQGQLRKELEAAEAAWLSAQEALEEALKETLEKAAPSGG